MWRCTVQLLVLMHTMMLVLGLNKNRTLPMTTSGPICPSQTEEKRCVAGNDVQCRSWFRKHYPYCVAHIYDVICSEPVSDTAVRARRRSPGPSPLPTPVTPITGRCTVAWCPGDDTQERCVSDEDCAKFFHKNYPFCNHCENDPPWTFCFTGLCDFFCDGTQPVEPTPAPPTRAPTHPTPAPTHPTPAPTHPTTAPTHPTPAPTHPTRGPTHPTAVPTQHPTPAPTPVAPTPTRGPTHEPSSQPPSTPTPSPSATPSPSTGMPWYDVALLATASVSLAGFIGFACYRRYSRATDVNGYHRAHFEGDRIKTPGGEAGLRSGHTASCHEDSDEDAPAI